MSWLLKAFPPAKARNTTSKNDQNRKWLPTCQRIWFWTHLMIFLNRITFRHLHQFIHKSIVNMIYSVTENKATSSGLFVDNLPMTLRNLVLVYGSVWLHGKHPPPGPPWVSPACSRQRSSSRCVHSRTWVRQSKKVQDWCSFYDLRSRENDLGQRGKTIHI